jgi:5-methylcytosine-specific restriction endonuclease McrA
MANDRKEYQREWRKKNPRILSERDKALKKAWAEKHAEETRQRNKVRYEAKKKQILDQCKAYQEANKEKISARRKARYQETLEESREARRHSYVRNKQKISERVRARYEKDRERILLTNRRSRERRAAWVNSLSESEREVFLQKQKDLHREYYERNKDRIRQAKKRYAKRNPDKILEKDARRRERLSVDTTLEEKEEVRLILLRWRRLKHCFCTYCDAPIEGSNRCVDHIVPLAGGGRHVASNLCLACRSCNSRKGAKILGESWFPPKIENT